ncbi:MAG TPA: (2Fe-2S)-binding protein [Rubrivivax sp.]|nr:(2Fe-2S)-binding protein [Burkholderiales bacterium]HNT39499.1 (2Fe-2S)-binding protein [Rubrivivax sp.]
MIVCLCHRVSDRDIQVAVKSGTASFDALQDDLRVGSACGCCQDDARSVFDAACACAAREPARAAAALAY